MCRRIRGPDARRPARPPARLPAQVTGLQPHLLAPPHPYAHPMVSASNPQRGPALTCQDSLGTALLRSHPHWATAAPASRTHAPALQGGAQPRCVAGPGAPMPRHCRDRAGRLSGQQAPGGQHTRGRTDLSSCRWKCWTFIWCAVRLLSHRSLRRDSDAEYVRPAQHHKRDQTRIC